MTLVITSANDEINIFSDVGLLLVSNITEKRTDLDESFMHFFHLCVPVSNIIVQRINGFFHENFRNDTKNI